MKKQSHLHLGWPRNKIRSPLEILKNIFVNFVKKLSTGIIFALFTTSKNLFTSLKSRFDVMMSKPYSKFDINTDLNFDPIIPKNYCITIKQLMFIVNILF